MSSAERWLLPDGVEEILPEQAGRLESLRRQLLDLYGSWGYQLVITPLMEYLDSLLVGSSRELDLHTFRITDQLSGRMMGVRADITPQVARIDARRLGREGPARLCYADSALHARPRGLMASRIPIRIGAELFGHAGVECDVELILLMRETLAAAEIGEARIVLGHVGIFRALLREAGLEPAVERELFAAAQRKAFDEIDAALAGAVGDAALRELLGRLTRMSGGGEVMEKAAGAFAGAPRAARDRLAELDAVADGVRRRAPDVDLAFDLCELRGYEYHTGVVFAAYAPGCGGAVAKGGRYDGIGEAFGRARPASGFDSDLRTLSALTARAAAPRRGIAAPDGADAALLEAVRRLREDGETVVTHLGAGAPDRRECEELGCDRRLALEDGRWAVRPAPSS